MLEHLCVAILAAIAYGSVAIYAVWYYKSDENGRWRKN